MKYPDYVVIREASVLLVRICDFTEAFLPALPAETKLQVM